MAGDLDAGGMNQVSDLNYSGKHRLDRAFPFCWCSRTSWAFYWRN
jgi:hypothetical protein